MLRRIQDTKNVAGIMLINKEGLAVKSSLDSSVTAQVRFTITMYCFYYVPLLLLMVFFPPRAPYLFILQHWLSKHAKLIILSLQQKTSWKYVSYRQFVKQSIFPAFSIVRYKLNVKFWQISLTISNCFFQMSRNLMFCSLKSTADLPCWPASTKSWQLNNIFRQITITFCIVTENIPKVSNCT